MKIGYAVTDITPPIGVDIAGYFSIRTSVDVLDNLYANAVVIESSGKRIALVSCDLLGMGQNYVDKIKNIVTEKTGIEKSKILIHTTHTHTGPKAVDLADESDKKISGDTDLEYLNYMVRQTASAIIMADLHKKEAIYGIGAGYEDTVAFIRRYKMKDGTVMTNPGVGNPNVIEPVGDIDPCVDLMNFKYVDGSGEILFVSYSLHADIVGGCKFSAGYPGAVRRKVEKAIPGCKVIYFTGAQGDINHIDVMEKNNTSKGYDYACKVGNILAGEVIKAYENIVYYEDCEVDSLIIKAKVPLRQFSQSDYDWAVNTIDDFKKGIFQQNNMNKTADIARAIRIRNSFKSGKWMELDVSLFKIGNTGIVGFPGEPFIGYKKKIVQDSGSENTWVLCLTNGSSGYLPVSEAYFEGGYETSNSPFTPELEKILVNVALDGLKVLFEKDEDS